MKSILCYLRRAVTPREGGSATDAQLLECFIARRDEAAFEALVRRHGPMVLGVCRRVLRDPHDAEDAFQATFLVLVRKASSVRPPEMVGNWLYGVAHRTALEAKKVRAKRQARERQVEALPETQAGVQDQDGGDLHAVLDQELSRLPDKYRVPVVLCDLEGKTRKEAACQLGWPEGTVSGRLARARGMLAKRLARRGIALSAGPLSVALSGGTASATLPTPLLVSTVTAARLLAAGQMPAGICPAHVISLTEGVLRAMFQTKLKAVVALLIGFALAGAGAGALAYRASAHQQAAPQQEQVPRPDANPVEAPKQETSDRRATRLALDVHARAAAIDKLPRFSYRVRYRHGIVDSMRAVDVSLDRLKQALTAPVLEKDWFGWYQRTFSWDEKRFLYELWPKEAPLNYDFRFWTADEGWERHEAAAKTSVNFVRFAGPAKLWKNLVLFDYSYLRLTPHRYWWGRTVWHGRAGVLIDQAMSPVPPGQASWRHLGVEKFGGEMCAVVESAQMPERLWIGQDSGRVRAALSYRSNESPGGEPIYKTDAVRRIAGKTFLSQQEYWNWYANEANEDQVSQVHVAAYERRSARFPSNAEPNELVRFDDYREVSPGVWLPFREVRTVPHASVTAKNKHLLRRSELVVEEVRTDRNLAGRYSQLLPREEEQVQDQRFIVPVNYKYSAKRTDDEILRMADAQYQERLKGQEHLKRLLQPVEAMVGKRAPALPVTGWVGGRRPDLAGKPYLVHFWATWCGPCKNDLPRLKTLAERGAIIVGMHPSGTPAEEVEKVIRDQQLSYPTFLAAGKQGDATNPKIGGYPSGVFPYCILVDAQGQVAGHGFLSELLEKVGVDKLIAPPKEDGKKQ